MNELLKLSSFALAQKIAMGEVTPTEAVEVYIAQIEKVNPALNALVEDDFIKARLTAAEQTERLRKSKDNLPPLFGVPFTIKEMLAVQGMKRTGGSIHHCHDVMDYDSTSVARLKAAGAIPLGTTNVPELGFWFETNNPVYGCTNNPYDLKRTCGGSSGGEAALLGAGASSFGIGSDIGGSLRMPAFFCGVFAHKPSPGLIPLTGHFPYQREDFKNVLKDDKAPYTVLGPITRKAVDLYPLMTIMMGADGYDSATKENPSLQKPVHDWSGKKVYLCPSPAFHGARRIDTELSQQVKNCGKLFEELGANVYELDPRFFTRATKLWFSALKKTKTKNFHEMLFGENTNTNIGKEIFKIAFGKGNYTFPNIMTSLLERLDVNAGDTEKNIAELDKMKKDLEALLGEDGILILPPHSRVAPKHRAPLWSPFDFISTGIFTTLGMPSTVIPTGLNDQGLPLGVQVVAKEMNDHLTLGCAEFLETTFGGWTPPIDF